jgi:hypothetical protein
MGDFYRTTSVGQALLKSLNTMIEEGKMSLNEANKILV